MSQLILELRKRRIINGADADVVQLYPMRHMFAWEAYNVGNSNHWLPTEISMQRDIEQWRSSTALPTRAPRWPASAPSSGARHACTV
ncbi:MAG: ribonucleotide-diphosphate reductase subunit beta, partial [Nanoarchaeota archaeon]